VSICAGRTDRWSWGVGVALALATVAAYLIGADRAFGYDASVTMANFVVGDLGDVFTRQAVFNNHPVFSLVEHVVWRVTGSSSEPAMRVAPAAFAGAGVGLMAWRVGARHGVRAGMAAGVTLAAHPFLVDGRDARGYSLAVLSIVCMGIFALERPRPWGFAAALAVGVGTQLYVLVAAAALVASLAVRGGFDRRWARATAAGATCGLAVYLGMADDMGRAGRDFRADFPLHALYELLGGSAVAVAAAVVVGTAAIVRRRPRRDVVAASAVFAAGLVVPWIVAPSDLYARFTFCAVPALAYLFAVAAARSRLASAAVAVFAVAAVVPLLPSWTDDELPNRELARVVPTETTVCAVGSSGEALVWYLPQLRVDDDCTLAANLSPEAHPNASALARDRWPVLCWAADGAELRSTGPCP
jgi:hypothetical protein